MGLTSSLELTLWLSTQILFFQHIYQCFDTCWHLLMIIQGFLYIFGGNRDDEIHSIKLRGHFHFCIVSHSQWYSENHAMPEVELGLPACKAQPPVFWAGGSFYSEIPNMVKRIIHLEENVYSLRFFTGSLGIGSTCLNTVWGLLY